jgi:hypothetical protein
MAGRISSQLVLLRASAQSGDTPFDSPFRTPTIQRVRLWGLPFVLTLGAEVQKIHTAPGEHPFHSHVATRSAA